MDRFKLATVWLGGCSGCHMSFLDLDEWLFDLVEQVDLVYSPLVDAKAYPEDVDIVLVEGAVANQEHLAMIRKVRDRSQFLISFGDCAVTGNVTALRNVLGSADLVLQRSYIEAVDIHPGIPDAEGIVPPLLDRVQPVHAIVPVDLYLPGCPPSADRIRTALESLLNGGMPQMEGHELIQFG